MRIASWHQPYPATKYYAHTAWFLADAGLEGRLYNDYSRGNFFGYWLAPRLQTFVNGSLNVPREVFEASLAIARGGDPGEASPTDLSGRSAYTRVLMGGKSDAPPRPSTPSPSAEKAQGARRSGGPAEALKSVPTWVLGAAGAVVTVIVVFILLAIFG